MTSYWWVSQNQTWKHERRGGYLWAPYEDKNGHDKFHWKNMDDVRIGDIIFSYQNKTIKAVSIATCDPFESKIPEEFGEKSPWKNIGRKINLEYSDLEDPIPLELIVEDIVNFLPKKYSPITSDKSSGVQGYLFSILPEAASIILARANLEHLILQDKSERSFSNLNKDQITTRKSLIDARIGQGEFRKELEERWKSCAVTDVNTSKLLIASHIKPWKKSDNKERLDVNNGILLLSSIDKAFDAGLITFSNEGELIYSKYANKEDMVKAGIKSSLKLRMVTDDMKPYLEYHRAFIFES